MVYQIVWRRGHSVTWTSLNPVLAQGEAGFEIDTGKFKVGDGGTTWNILPYYIDEAKINELLEDLVVEGVPGPQGPQGIQGLPGIQGPVGAQGIQGIQGPAGADGADGESVTVTLVPAEDWPPAADSNPLHLYFRVP